MSSDASLILHPVRLLLESAPSADAADTVVEKWGKYVVQLLNGLKDRRPEFLSRPEVVSIVNLLQTIADARLRVDWLAWGGDWLPGTVIEHCLSQLSVAATDDSTPLPPAPLPSPAATSNATTQPSLNRFEVPIISPRVTPAKDAAPAPVSRTCSVKRAAPNEASSSCIRPTKRAHITTSTTTLELTKNGSPKDQLDLHLLHQPRKVLYKCSSCESSRNPRKPCLTVTKKGAVQDRCAWCIIGHRKCDWKGYLKENRAYRKDFSSFYDPVGPAGVSERSALGTTSASAHRASALVTVCVPKLAPIRPPYGPKSAIKRRYSESRTASLSSPSGASTPLLSTLLNITPGLLSKGTGGTQPAKKDKS